MSKTKGTKADRASTIVDPDQPHTAHNTPGTSGLSEDSFKNLKDKISGQLKTIAQKTDRKKKDIKQNVVNNLDDSRGKKRSADGTIVKKQHQKDTSRTSNTVVQADTVDDEDELRTALKELGGTEEDLELIAGAGSESELEGQDGGPDTKQRAPRKGTTLEDGIANILKEIAIVQGKQDHGTSEPEDDSRPSEDEVSEPVKQDKSHVDVSVQSTAKPSKRDKAGSHLKCQPRADWYNISAHTFDSEEEPKNKPTRQALDQLHAHAKALLATENGGFRSTEQSASSQAFYNTVIASGTLSDKISALTLAVQESPLHNMKALENLVSLAGKRNRAQAVDVLRALKDLFAQGSLLPSDRRLYSFATQPVLLAACDSIKTWNKGDKLPRGLQESDLICWAYEDWLKQQYFEILKILEVWCNDEIEYAKGRAVSYVFELLKEKPEQESNLLRLLINKLGDPVKKIASQTSYSLMQLLSSHPAMKLVVISAIEADFIFRPGQSMHGIYYAAVTLNQTALSTREEDVAKKLLSIYFGLFTTLLKPSNQVNDNADDDETTVQSQTRGQRQRQNKRKKKPSENAQSEDLREKLVSAVLTGVNRAYPYVGSDEKDFPNHLETLFKITHSANFNTGIQAMLLIQQLTSTHSASADRFYRTLYESLLDPRLITASKQQLYLNLLHRSLKADMNAKRVKAFVKRLLQILTLHDASFICGVFFLLKDLERTYPSLTSLIDQPEDHENDEEIFRDVDEDAVLPIPNATDGNPGRNQYDGSKRTPEHANADNSCAWEVLPFLAHFHPSVTVSADHYMEHTKLPGKPDLALHTLIHFLDRFVYRNPKLAANKLRGSSIMQPMASDDSHAVLISSGAGQFVPAVNTDEFKNKKDKDVAADDVFFHKYFTTLGKETKAKKEKAREIDEDGSVGDEGEDAVWKAMIDSAPDLEGELSDDEDIDMSDFEEDMNSEDNLDENGGMDLDDDEESDVDIEAGIFDDSDDELDADTAALDEDSDKESEFEGLGSDDEVVDAKKTKQKDERKAKKEQRKKMKALPTFASAADYAKMLDADEDEDLG